MPNDTATYRVLRDPQAAFESRWWTEDGVVEHFLAGVFEGGGAKGVAYGGALQGVLLRKCWFSAVAGASAGGVHGGVDCCGTDTARNVAADPGRAQHGVW